MTPLNGLTIAVPRGALFADTVDLLAELGIDTDELRTNDRKLLFEDVGVITMRPSDVPTYVEAGAADLGVTGKDVLLEQTAQEPGEHGRQVYELLDLGYGRCTMVLAGKAGEDTADGVAAPAGGDARRHQVPARGRPPHGGDRPPGRDRRGQGLGRARAADGPGRGDRRPHRHRHHPAREQPRRSARSCSRAPPG